MYKLIAIMALTAALLSTGCNKGTGSDASTATAPANKILASAEASSAAPESEQETPAYETKAGTELALSDDQKVMIISVADLDAKSADYEGLVAIEGRVSESYPDKASFILVDCDNMQGCKDGCCPQTRVPVRIAQAEGQPEITVPVVDEMVIVIAQLSLTETGYALAVQDVRKVGQA